MLNITAPTSAAYTQNPFNVIILGAGAIGSALAQCIIEKHSNARVILTYNKNPPTFEHQNLATLQLNATNENEFLSLNKHIKGSIQTVHWIINTIGILHNEEHNIFPEKRLLDFNPSAFTHVLETNVLPTVYAAKHLAPLLDKTRTGIMATVSAKVGSIEDNRQGGWYSYRASKACLNMMLKTIAIELNHKNKNACVLALHPGTTASNLSLPFQKNVPQGKLFTPKRTAKQLMAILEQATPKNTGSFYNWDGAVLPW